MKTLLAVTCFAVLAAYPAAACDWNRQANGQDPIAAATLATTDLLPTVPAASSRTAPAAADQSTGQPLVELAPVVLVSDRRE